MVDFVFIYKNKFFNIEIKIYYQIMEAIIKKLYNYKAINIINKLFFSV